MTRRKIAPGLLIRAETFACMSVEERDAALARMALPMLRFYRHCWEAWARPEQLPPDGDWAIWLIMAGRGFGKTRAGAEWVRRIARRTGERRIAIVGATMDEARQVMVEGESGILNIGEDWERPDYEPALGRLSWKSGALGFLHSAADPDSLRGPQFDAAWADEIAKWRKGEAVWSNLRLTVRLGDRPRIVATTTPRPVPLVRQLVKDATERDRQTIVTRGRMQDNRLHLPPGFVAAIQRLYGGTRLGRQELDGELIEDVENSLWPRALIETCRVTAAPEMVRVVVAVDPPAGAGEHSDACGIVAAGRGSDGRGYVLADASVQGLRPEGWAAKVADTAAAWKADRVIAEANQGGEMVRSVLAATGRILPLRLIHASRGKSARAEPVAAYYENGHIRHAGTFPALEDEMAGLTIDGRYEGPGRSPDRADALVYALTELMLGGAGRPGVRGL